MKNLRRTARRHQAVNSEIWYEFPPGLRVMTPDGIEGVVKDVEDGPYPGYEQYVVELDGGMGGGEYDSIELKMRCTGCGAWFGPDSQDSDITDSVGGDHDDNEHWNAEVDAFHTRTVQTGTGGRVAANLARRCSALTKTADEDQCPYDGSDSIMEDGLYRCEVGDIWSPDDPAARRYHGDGPERGKIQPRTSMVRHATSDEARDWGWAGREDMDGEGFIEPPYAEDVQASLRVASEDYPELAQILVDRPPLPHSTRMGSLQTTAASIPAIPDWAILQQFSQYPPSGPEGVSYFKGEIDAENWVDCLLYYTGGRLVGVLNHFPKDMGPERKGNVLVMVHPEYRLQGIGRALWAEAVSRWGVTKQQDTSPDGAAFLNRMSALAGFWDRALEPVADRMLEKQQESGYGTYNPDTGAMASYDWCRFRHNRRCFYPKQLDDAATKQAGYAVWVPEDRGFCPREKWDAQKACPAPSEPGPNSGDPNWRYETWKSWADGGQGRYAHLGMPAMPGQHVARDIEQSIKDIPKPPPPPDYEGEAYRAELAEVVNERKREKNPYAVSSLAAHLTEGEFGFHMTATWREVQAKAKKIRSEGHVRIISASAEYLVGQVQGETNVYQTSLMREPGTKRVAMWECGCAWAAYSWGRSGRWKKFEGRLCSHALALNYEAQSRGWAGGTVSEDTRPPGWLTDQKVIVPGDYQRGPIGEWRKAVRLPPATAGLQFTAMPAGTFSSYEDVAAWLYGQAKQAEPAVTNLLRSKASEHFGEMQGLNFRFKEPESIARKLQTKGVDPTSAFDPFEKVKDALRYTVALPEPDWANSVQNILWAVQGSGYRITEEENTWARGDSYSGLHYNFQTPVGLVFEVQFHTASSYDLKDKVLHKMYEEFRNPATPLQRRQQLWDEMTKYWDEIPIPEGAMEFPGEKHYLRPVAVTAREVVLDSEVAGRPVDAVFAALLDDGLDAHEASVVLESAGISAEAMSAQPFRGIVRGLITEIVDLFDDGTVETRQGRVPAREVLYPTYHPTRGLTAALSPATAVGADLDGYMLAIEVPDAVKDALHTLCEARYGGDVEPKDNYHVTVLYPGKADDVDADAFTAASLEWANRWSPMTGRISGFGVFHQEGGDKVLYASVNIPGLDRARDDLVDILSSYGVVVPDDYGFTPHLTLGYFGEANTPQPPEQMEDDVLTAEFPIEAVTLALGGNWRQIPLAGAVVSQEKVAGIVDDAVDLLSFGNDLGLVDADAVRWYSGSEAGQAAAQADMTGWGQQVADQFNAENPPLGDGCEVCGDSGHSTEQHIADPVKYDDGTRTGSASSRPEAFADWYQQVEGASDIDITDLMAAFNAGVTPEEMNSRREAELRDEPEAALPETTAEDEDPEDVAAIIANFQQTAAGKALAAGGAAKSGEGGDVALAAKQALKAFSPAEQKQIIDEGEGVTAANLGDLDITGTHYEALEAALAEAEASDDWMLG